jgi:uncharacterized protein (TIGR03435 family)
MRTSSRLVAFCTIAFFVASGRGWRDASAQTPSSSFEIVSLQRGDYRCPAFSFDATPCPPPRTTWTMLPGGRIELENQLAIDLVRVAYGVERLGPKYVSGVPGWMWDDRYDLIALTGEIGVGGRVQPTVDARARARLRLVLEERFKLRARLVKKKMDVLVLAKGKGTFTPALEPADDCEPSADVATAGIDFTSPPCDIEVRFDGFGARGMTMAALAQVISAATGMPVLDETGIPGRFDLSADWRGRRELNGVYGVKAIAAGLKPVGLDVRKASREMDALVIDSVERPEEDR